jgi:hypothetical protein
MLEWIESGTSFYGLSDGVGITSFSFGIPDEEVIIRPRPPGINSITPITVILPSTVLDVTNLSPVIEYIGKYVLPGSEMSRDFTSPVPYTVYGDNGSSRAYKVSVIVKASTVGEIIWFDLELPGGSMAEGSVVQGSPGTITIHVPSGTPSVLPAKIVQTGKSLSAPGVSIPPDPGTTVSLTDTFSGPYPHTYMKTYTVTAEDTGTKDYIVTVTVDPSADTGIFDFKVFKDSALAERIPNVVIGQKPRSDGKIPIVIQVPYGTDEKDMYATIDLNHPGTVSPGNGLITFSDQEAVYTVTAEDGITTQDYVAVVSEGPQYYYVKAGGKDDWPDYYNGGSESRPFKTLAYAVQKAAKDGIEKVLIIGDLTAANGGTTSGDSAFNIDLSLSANKKVTIGSNDAATPSTLRGASPQRVLSITGGADLTFENINVTGGDFPGIVSGSGGGGIYVGGNSMVDFSGNITGNRARSGGGVYVEAGTGGSDHSQFILTSGTITSNTATGAASGDPNVAAMEGGGGVYLKGNADFLLDGGTISNNRTAGAGGGVLVNGNNIGPTDGFIMVGGQITDNRSTSGTYPHGGGGVYVAHGSFNMNGGEVIDNNAVRQGGGVFVHWGDTLFNANNATITGNIGVGSSRDICNRGTTELQGTTTAEYVYIWDYDGASPVQKFTLTDNVRITTGIALAYSGGNNNFITFTAGPITLSGVDPINIDLESHLEDGTFAGYLEPDWRTKTILAGAYSTLTTMVGRFKLNSFIGSSTVYGLSANYEIVVSGTTGTFERK